LKLSLSAVGAGESLYTALERAYIQRWRELIYSAGESLYTALERAYIQRWRELI